MFACVDEKWQWTTKDQRFTQISMIWIISNAYFCRLTPKCLPVKFPFVGWQNPLIFDISVKFLWINIIPILSLNFPESLCPSSQANTTANIVDTRKTTTWLFPNVNSSFNSLFWVPPRLDLEFKDAKKIDSKLKIITLGISSPCLKLQPSQILTFHQSGCLEQLGSCPTAPPPLFRRLPWTRTPVLTKGCQGQWQMRWRNIWGRRCVKFGGFQKQKKGTILVFMEKTSWWNLPTYDMFLGWFPLLTMIYCDGLMRAMFLISSENCPAEKLRYYTKPTVSKEFSCYKPYKTHHF